MITKAIAYSDEKRITINWKRYYDLLDAYGIDKGDKEFLIKKEEPTRKEKPAYKTKSELQFRPRSAEETRCGELSRQKDEEWAQTKLTMDLKRTLAEQNPLQEVQTWRQWTKTEDYKQIKGFLGWTDAAMVSPSVVEIIYNKKIGADIIDLLFLEFPFLEERCLLGHKDPFHDENTASLANVLSKMKILGGERNETRTSTEKYTPKQYASDYISTSSSTDVNNSPSLVNEEISDNLWTDDFESSITNTNTLFEGSITDEPIETFCDQWGSGSSGEGTNRLQC
jgi:hypothetical protein